MVKTEQQNKTLTSAHGVYVYLELLGPREETLDGVEVKDGPEHVQVHLHRVHDLH